MASQQKPLLLRVWMLVTRCFALPIIVASWALHRRMGADPRRFPERLGHDALHTSASVVWFHAASLGEVTQIAPLASHLMSAEKLRILVTTTTATGADWVSKHMPAAIHRYAPIDTPRAVARFLDGWSISAALFVEGDLWPRLLDGLDQRGVPRVLLNARHSRTRARFPIVFATLLGRFAFVTCRSGTVATEMIALGLPADRVHVVPDLRLSLPKPTASQEALSSLSRTVGKRPVWLAASTHPPDETAVLAAHLKVLETCPDALLIVAPRHPTRGAPLQKLARSKALTAVQRSKGKDILATTQVYIADTLGELGVFFSLCPITFMGGSFGQEGGHTPYEAIYFDTAVVHGPNVKNFVDAYAELQNKGAAQQVKDSAQLGKVISDLLHGDQAKTMGQAGLAYVSDSQNCMFVYADLIKDIPAASNPHQGLRKGP